MIIKIDIEKAFYWVECHHCYPLENAFPELWISWIFPCISSTSFSFLLNGQNSAWTTNNRGIRQGDPIFPLFFLLVTQNLSTILNKVLSLTLVSRFNLAISHDSNHLMFVDDLLLITKASRKTARNCLMCLNIYHSITGQKPNLNKLAVYFPSWCNKKLSNSISHILGINQGSFPFSE